MTPTARAPQRARRPASGGAPSAQATRAGLESWRRSACGLACAVLLLGAVPASAARPNLVLVLVEDFGSGPGPATPALDALAARGRRFTRAYAQYPAAAPSRASLLTGMRPETTRVWEPEPRERPRDSTPLQEHLAAQGYWVARVGPVYRGEAESKLRWDAALDLEPGAAEPGRRAAGLLSRRPSQPFLLVMGLERGLAPAPAGPGPGSSSGGVPPELESLPALLERPLIALGHPGFFARPGRSLRVAPLPEPQRRLRLAQQASWRGWVDAQLAALLAALEREALTQQTLLVVAGDHGPDLGREGALRDDLLSESRLRVPLLIAGPGVEQPGRASDALVELLDLYPTLVEQTGVAPVPELEGTSLSPLLRDPRAAVRGAVFSAVERRAGQLGRSLRTRRWRLNEWPDGSQELYDHQRDPGERVNLALDPASLEQRRALLSLLDEREHGTRLALERRAPRERPPRRRNVLLLVFDDLANELGSYGRPVETPSIDALARRGRRFDRAYAQAPECTPSRLSFLTGWLPERVVVWDYFDHTNQPVRRQLGWLPIQEHFKNHGYFTAAIGKIDDGLFPERFGWDLVERSGTPPAELAGRAPAPVSQTAWWSLARYLGPRQAGKPGWWIATGDPDALEPDALRVRRAIQLIEQRRGAPFFVALGLTTPHLRWVAPERWFARYDPERVRLPPAQPGDLDDVPAVALKRDPQDRPGAPLAGLPRPLYGPPRENRGLIDDPALRRQAIAAYRASVSFVDSQVGELNAALSRLGLWQDTVVVLLSDHGFHLGEHGGLWRKDTLFEEALRVPLIVAAPGIGFPGVATGELAELTDVYPTVAELAGLPEPPGLDGVSLVPLLRDPQQPVRRAAVSLRETASPQLGISVRRGRWRYTEWPDGSRELYDLEADPDGIVDLARDPARAEPLAAMRRVLDRGYRAAEARFSGGGGR